MNADEFNKYYDKYVIEPLIQNGFQKQKKYNLFLETESSLLSLFRFSDKWSPSTQSTNFIVCIRHTFLRDLDGKIKNGFIENINDYPVKIHPSRLKNIKFRKFSIGKWHYEPINLGIRDNHYLRIKYVDIDNPTKILKDLSQNVLTGGRELQNFLTPDEMFRQIKKYGELEIAVCEQDWIKDYTNWLSKHN